MNTQKIKLNLIPGGIPPIVHVSQYDVGRPLAFELYDGMSAATIEAGTVVDIRATKPDGTGFEYACTWENNVVSIATQAQMTVLAGQIECELHLVKNQQEIGTANFILEVEEAALRADTDISETEIPDIIDLARSHEQAATASAEAAAESEENAADSASAAATSESNAADSASAAATSESNAADSASAAATSESNASNSETAAANSATAAAGSATSAANSKSDAEAYAVGKRGGVDVTSTDPTYNNNAKHYAEVASQAAAGGIIPQGTTTFAQLPALSDVRVGYMWNISDDFVTTADFREGAGVRYGAGSNVYKTGDGKWDVTSGQMIMMQGATVNAAGTPGAVTGAAAGQQDHYWTGKGDWENDTTNLITSFTSSDDSTENGIIISSGGEIEVPEIVTDTSHGGLFGLISKSVLNVRKLINTVKRIWNSVGATWVSDYAYTVNDIVVYENGHVYKCKAAHTSSASILPTNTTYWTDTTLAAEIVSLNTKMGNKANVTRAFPSAPSYAAHNIQWVWGNDSKLYCKVDSTWVFATNGIQIS